MEDIAAKRVSKAIDGLISAELGLKDIKEVFRVLAAYVPRTGLSNSDLDKLIKLVTSGNALRTSQSLVIVRDFLVPREKIPSNVVLRIVSALADQNPTPIRVKEKLLRWLVVCSRFLEDPKILSKLYGILFMNLKYELLRPWICHLLFVSTTSVMVKAWRIQYVIELYRMNKESKHLCALLMLYREYAPHLIVDRFPVLKATVFQQPDPEFEEHVTSIQEATTQNTANPGNNVNTARLLYKRRKLEIPAVQTDLNRTQMGVEDVNSLTEFSQKVHHLKLPMQMGSVLQDIGFAVRLLIYKDDDKAWDRLNTWLVSILFAELQNPEALHFLLTKVDRFTKYTKILPIAVEEFLYHYLRQWDGDANKKLVFSLISYLPVMNLQILTSYILEPLARIMILKDILWRIDLINTLGNLIVHWDSSVGKTILKRPQTVEDIPLQEAEKLFHVIARFVSEFGLEILEQSNDDIAVQQALLRFYEILSSLSFNSTASAVVVFSSDIAHRLIFSSSAVTFSRMCGLLSRYQDIYSQSSDESKNQFGALFTDMRDLVLNNRALSGNTKFGLSNDFVQGLEDLCKRRNESLSELFGLSYSTLFILMTTQHARYLESKDFRIETQHHGPITKDSLERIKDEGGLNIPYDEFRQGLLKLLKTQGYEGISTFCENDITGVV